MASLYLTDILTRNNLDPKRAKLIRHSLKDPEFRQCYMNGFMETYQKIQKAEFFKNCDYFLAFVSEPGTSAKFMGCYKVGEGMPIHPSMMPEQFPADEMFFGDAWFFDLRKEKVLGDLAGRLVIDWGRAALSWHQWATNEKAVIAIQERPRLSFHGYENVLLSYGELREIVRDPTLYENWHTALSSVYAIYLIADITNGKLYVGSAYGSGGLLGRWKQYADTGHGGNKGMKAVVRDDPDRYKYFQFSILQVLPKNITAEEVIEVESLFKRKLQSIQYGMNEN